MIGCLNSHQMGFREAASFLLVLLFNISYSLATISNEDSCGVPPIERNVAGRIVNGTNAIPGRWPWQALLLRFFESTGFYHQVCGGSLINDQWVLTAAHCFSGEPVSHTQVALGSYFRNASDSTTKRMALSNIFCHQSYRNGTGFFANDICLLKLAAKVTYTDHIQPVCLPSVEDTLSTGMMCSITGWGRTKGTADQNILQEANVNILNMTQCRSWYREHRLTISEKHFCAGYEEGMIDSCQGDSGGPLVCEETTTDSSRYVLHGVTSFGKDCAVAKQPGVYTTVAKHLDWIETVMNENSGIATCFSDLPLPCDSVITSDAVIRSPIENEESWLYPPNADCSWSIVAPKNFSVILEFMCYFHIEGDPVESCYDYLEVQAVNSGQDFFVCGSSLNELGNGRILLDTNEVILDFQSDGSEQSTGFYIKVILVAPNTTSPTTTPPPSLKTETGTYQPTAEEGMNTPDSPTTSWTISGDQLLDTTIQNNYGQSISYDVVKTTAVSKTSDDRSLTIFTIALALFTSNLVLYM